MPLALMQTPPKRSGMRHKIFAASHCSLKQEGSTPPAGMLPLPWASSMGTPDRLVVRAEPNGSVRLCFFILDDRRGLPAGWPGGAVACGGREACLDRLLRTPTAMEALRTLRSAAFLASAVWGRLSARPFCVAFLAAASSAIFSCRPRGSTTAGRSRAAQRARFS